MKTYDKAAMIAEFLADMKAVDDAPSDVAPDGIQSIDDSLTTLIQACVDIAKVVAESDEEMDFMLEEYVDLMYTLADRPKP